MIPAVALSSEELSCLVNNLIKRRRKCGMGGQLEEQALLTFS